MTFVNEFRAKQEQNLVSVTDTFYSEDGSELFCVMAEETSNLIGVRSFICEEVETGRRVHFTQHTIARLMGLTK